MAINMSPASFQHWVASEGLEQVLAPMRWIFDLLQLQSGSVVAVTLDSLRRGHFGLKEKAFRALECIEFGIMYRFVELLTQHSTISSLIWLHDGVWMSPLPCRSLLDKIDSVVCREHSLSPNPPLFRVTELRTVRESVVAALPRRRNRLPTMSAWTAVLPVRIDAQVSRTRPSDVQLMSNVFFQRQLRSNPGYADTRH